MPIDEHLKREIIMDHYQYPHNHSLTDDKSYGSRHMASDSCIDDITVQAKMEGDKIEDIRFDGEACTLSTASTSIMSDLLKGKTLEEARAIVQEYMKMVNLEDYDEEPLEEAVAFETVGKQANRINCATIGWKAILELIDEQEAKLNGKQG